MLNLAEVPQEANRRAYYLPGLLVARHRPTRTAVPAHAALPLPDQRDEAELVAVIVVEQRLRSASARAGLFQAERGAGQRYPGQGLRRRRPAVDQEVLRRLHPGGRHRREAATTPPSPTCCCPTMPAAPSAGLISARRAAARTPTPGDSEPVLRDGPAPGAVRPSAQAEALHRRDPRRPARRSPRAAPWPCCDPHPPRRHPHRDRLPRDRARARRAATADADGDGLPQRADHAGVRRCPRRSGLRLRG